MVQENKRPSSVREEFSIQGMTGINAYDGRDGWKIEPWNGKRDPEALGEEEMHSILDDADFDGPLVNYQAKGNRVEFQGVEQIEGSDAYKLKVTRPNGDVSFYYLDTEYYVPIRIDTQRMIRGAPQEYETSLGDYKQVAGVYLPFAYESGPKGWRTSRSKMRGSPGPEHAHERSLAALDRPATRGQSGFGNDFGLGRAQHRLGRDERAHRGDRCRA